MICKSLLCCFFSITVCFLATTVVPSEAIIGGFLPYDLLPYQVSVQIQGDGHVCGGGIISEKFVLSAAHCVLNRTRHLRGNIYILAETCSLESTAPPAVSVRVEKVFFPSEFHPTIQFSYGDIAVLELANSLQVGLRTKLKKLKLSRNDGYLGGLLIAGFGWNRYNDGVGGTDGYLRTAGVSIYLDDECEKVYPLGAIQADRHFCAKSRRLLVSSSRRSRGVCFGDSGNPLVYNRTIVVGILSRIPPHCDEQREPPVYTRVSHYAMMIVSVMEHGDHSGMIEVLSSSS